MMRTDSGHEAELARAVAIAIAEPLTQEEGDFETRRESEIAASPPVTETYDVRAELAFHESAHAVVAVALGGTLTQCRMTDNEGGRVVYHGIESPLDRIAVALAGPVGHSMLTGEPVLELSAGRALWDFYTARSFFNQLPEDYRDAGFRLHLGHRARTLVQRRWASIMRVGAALMVQRALTDAEVRAHL